jgi:glutamyl-tRNA synthetase
MSDLKVVRMAPSPTGEYHVGHIATLLKNYAFAKKYSGQFVLRIEDTDQERKVEGAVERIMGVIKAYGLSWDEGPDIGGPYEPYTQSERLPLYKKYAEQLVADGKAYYCFCSSERLEALRESQREAKVPPKYDKHCRNLSEEEVQQKLAAGEPHVIRLAVPSGETITFNDLIRGQIDTPSDSVDDQVLLKSDGFPTYHLAVVVDDNAMKITHVMRGEEWISSTPKHVLLYEAFGWEQPVYAHIPVFLNPDGQGKMSKRKGTVAAQSFLDEGYLPEAMLNFFMILGWTPEDQREILTLDEYIQEFDPKEISAKSVVFDLQKLAWLNGVYIRNLTQDQLMDKLVPFLPEDFPHDKADQIIPLIWERLVKLNDVTELTEFFYREVNPPVELMLKKSDAAQAKLQLEVTANILNKINDWTVEKIEEMVRQLQTTNNWKTGQYFMLIRVAVTGKVATPPLFETMAVCGKDTVIERLHNAIKALS